MVGLGVGLLTLRLRNGDLDLLPVLGDLDPLLIGDFLLTGDLDRSLRTGLAFPGDLLDLSCLVGLGDPEPFGFASDCSCFEAWGDLDFFPFPPLSSPDSLLELSPDDDDDEEELPESELLPLEALLLEELFDLDASDELSLSECESSSFFLSFMSLITIFSVSVNIIQK